VDVGQLLRKKQQNREELTMERGHIKKKKREVKMDWAARDRLWGGRGFNEWRFLAQSKKPRNSVPMGS